HTRSKRDWSSDVCSSDLDAGVPVLWRPLHEFDGQWFWWGKGGPKNFRRLWQLMYNRFTMHHGLNNLIWVLGYSGEIENGWYPGDEYVDISGADTYDSGSHIELYDKVVQVVGSEMPIDRKSTRLNSSHVS